MQVIKYPERNRWKEITVRPVSDNADWLEAVMSIVADVRENGDRALLDYALKFDKVALSCLEVSEDEIKRAKELVSEDLRNAIARAIRNIEKFHLAQQIPHQKIETEPGVVCWQKSVGIERVGLYVPGGTAPLFSTVLMLAIPAKIAGCKEIILCTPPNKSGEIHPAILYAAHQTGVHRIFKTGGAQAIAAMAHGTETIPRVYKIFGPGNQYVTTAKQLVSRGNVAIDMPAGPSEVEVIADETANPAFVAADLLSQAEHGADSQVILVSKDESIINRILVELEIQLYQLPRRELAEKSLKNSRIILLKDDQEIIDFTNEYAPEHLIIETSDYIGLSEQIVNAGSVFLGHYTPESAGDYASGTNHTLPTNGYAKSYNGVNLDSFVKKITFQEISREGLQSLGKTIEIMAENEELYAHKNAVSLRISQ